jgi:predicted MFS family arabinose efflux permease
MPAIVGVAALFMIWLPVQISGLMCLIVLWGLAFGGVPVAWSNWVARAVPDQAETAGGMVVASVQSSIAAGAALGGFMFGFSGVAGVFITAGSMMLLAALFIAIKVRVALPQHGQPDTPATHF